MAVAAKAKAHADFAGNGAHGAAGNAEQADLLDVSGMPEPVLFFGKFLRAAAGAEDHADFALLLHRTWRRGSSAGVLNGFGRGGNRQRHDARDMFALARVDPGQFVEFRNFAGNVHRQVGRIETRNAFDAGFARKNGAAKSFFAHAIRADDAHSGDHYAREHSSL